MLNRRETADSRSFSVRCFVRFANRNPICALMIVPIVMGMA